MTDIDPMEAAAKALNDTWSRTWPSNDKQARITVLAYLRTLAERGPSERVLNDIYDRIRSVSYHDPKDHCAAVVAALIKEIER